MLKDSPRWLINNGKFDDAEQVIRHIATINKRTVPDDLQDKLRMIKVDEDTKEQVKGCKSITTAFSKVASLFRTPTIRKWTLILSFHW